MKRERGLTRMSIIAVLILPGLLGATRAASAAGRGGTISLGAVSGNTVEVNTTAAADSWNAFNIHVTTRTSPGVALTGITAAKGTALQGQWTCPSSVPPAGEYIFACVGVESQSVTAPGSMASVTFAATGNGCIGASLVNAPGDELLDTFTVDSATSRVQAVTVSTTTATILIGTGTAADCVGLIALPSGGLGPSSDADPWTWIGVSVLVIGALSLGLGVRRPRRSAS